jgi:pimeloyl-ACP methyl ester carboxylesterase
MAHFACRAVSAYNSSPHFDSAKGLIALSFDQRNHGSRLVDKKANGAWREGNERHAQDMFGVIAGTVSDQERLIDAVGGYLFHDDREKRVIDRHLVLGVSLGGHSVWQTMFLDRRVVAGVVVIGCPDFEGECAVSAG